MDERAILVDLLLDLLLLQAAEARLSEGVIPAIASIGPAELLPVIASVLRSPIRLDDGLLLVDAAQLSSEPHSQQVRLGIITSETSNNERRQRQRWLTSPRPWPRLPLGGSSRLVRHVSL